VRVWTDAAGITHTANVHKSQLLINHIVPHDSDTIPAESPVKLQPEDSLDLRVQKCIELLRKALNKRPVMSRRVQMSVTGAPTEQILRATWAYLGYMFKSGPFKDTLIKFGVDPRSDPKYREYQSIAIQVPETGRNNKRRYGKGPQPSKTPRTYMFDGKGVYVDGKVWQVCDISDPLLKRLIREASPVTEYEVRFPPTHKPSLTIAASDIRLVRQRLLGPDPHHHEGQGPPHY
jgi:general transcription factor 3C polypeptide 5 (transcription factor C subunit 1)